MVVSGVCEICILASGLLRALPRTAQLQLGWPHCPTHRQPECGASHGLPGTYPQPQTPHLEEDLKEVLRSEAGIELIIEDDVRSEKQKRKPGVSGVGVGEPGQGELEPWHGGGIWGQVVESEALGRMGVQHVPFAPFLTVVVKETDKIRTVSLGPSPAPL